MKKRSAMTVAAGLVAALLAGGVALSLGFAGPRAASAGSGHATPRVRTIERTITVHRKAKAQEPVVRTIAAPAPATQPVPASASTATSGPSDDDQQEEAFDDDQFEGEHESDDDQQSGGDQQGSDDQQDDDGFEDD